MSDVAFRKIQGWRCEVCFREGQINQGRSTGVPLDEADRCKGCGETICDRHASGPQEKPHPNGWEFHTYTDQTDRGEPSVVISHRMVVEEVKPPS